MDIGFRSRNAPLALDLERTPPNDGRTWFPTHLVRIDKASFITPDAVYDAEHGMGRLSPGRMFFSWDSGFDPRSKLPPAPLIDLRRKKG